MLADSKGIKWDKKGVVQLAGRKRTQMQQANNFSIFPCHQGNTGYPPCKHTHLRLHEALLCHFLFDNCCTPKTCLQPGSRLRRTLSFTTARPLHMHPDSILPKAGLGGCESRWVVDGKSGGAGEM